MSMKTLMRILLSIVCVSVITFAHAGTYKEAKDTYVVEDYDYYVGIHGGANVPGDAPALDTGWLVGAQLGFIYKPFRAEVAYTYYNNNLDFGGDFDTHTVMVNGYYDYPLADAFNLYIGAGLGWAHFDASGFGSDDRFAYQGLVGANYRFRDNMSFDVGYRIQSWDNNDGVFYNLFVAGLNWYF